VIRNVISALRRAVTPEKCSLQSESIGFVSDTMQKNAATPESILNHSISSVVTDWFTLLRAKKAQQITKYAKGEIGVFHSKLKSRIPKKSATKNA
jgi:hypothetical protein